MFFEQIAEAKIKEAMENGEFDNLANKGRPLDLTDYFSTPAELRLGYSVLKSAGCVPEEVALRAELEQLTDSLNHCTDENRRARIKAEIKAKALKLALLSDASRRARSHRQT